MPNPSKETKTDQACEMMEDYQSDSASEAGIVKLASA